MPLTAEYVLAELERNAETLRGFGVKRIGLFGSVARGEAREDSDLDLIIELADYDEDMYFGVMEYLESLFGREVDMVTPGGIRRELQRHILPEIQYAKVV
jgi:uncharacterized protein